MHYHTPHRFVLTTLLSLALLPGCTRKEPFEAVVTGVAGTVEMLRYDANAWEPLDTLDALYLGDSVRVLDNSQAELTFGEGEGNTVLLESNTRIGFTDTLDSNGYAGLEVGLSYGAAHSRINDLGDHYAFYRVRTPEVVAQARGTYFCVTYELSTRASDVDVAEGEVRVWRPDFFSDVVIVPPGFFVSVPWGRVPSPPEHISLIRRGRLERATAPHPMLRRPVAFAAAMQKPSPRRHGLARPRPGGGPKPVLKRHPTGPRLMPAAVHAKRPVRAVKVKRATPAGGRRVGPAAPGKGGGPGKAKEKDDEGKRTKGKKRR